MAEGAVRAYVQKLSNSLPLPIGLCSESRHGAAHFAAVSHPQALADPLIAHHRPRLDQPRKPLFARIVLLEGRSFRWLQSQFIETGSQ